MTWSIGTNVFPLCQGLLIDHCLSNVILTYEMICMLQGGEWSLSIIRIGRNYTSLYFCKEKKVWCWGSDVSEWGLKKNVLAKNWLLLLIFWDEGRVFIIINKSTWNVMLTSSHVNLENILLSISIALNLSLRFSCPPSHHPLPIVG